MLQQIIIPAVVFILALPGVGGADENAVSEAKPEEKDAKQENGEKPLFIRLTRDDQQSPVALETAIVRYRLGNEPDAGANTGTNNWTVDLVGVLHIAEKSYYAQLNREFESYDAVLYELVATEETKVPQREASTGNHPLTLFQNGLKDMLGLEYQLKGIDYTRSNMVHADMSPEEFTRSMEQKGETPLSMLSRVMGYEIARQGQSSDLVSGSQMLFALFDKNRALSMKRLMAEQFNENDSSLAALEGPNGSTLISGRNAVALKVLQEQVAAGKKKMAIFYGAGHMPDMQKQLMALYPVECVETRWLAAWDLKTPPAAVPSKSRAKSKSQAKKVE